MRPRITSGEHLLLAVCDRPENQLLTRPFTSTENAMAFFRACDDQSGPEVEPDWSEHLRVISESRASKVAGK